MAVATSEVETMKAHHLEHSLAQAVKDLREIVPRLVAQLQMAGDAGISAWRALIDKKLLPKLSPDFPLVASICGGGSSGKSSLFNALIQENVSPTGGAAGINRRILISANAERFQDTDGFVALFQRFGFQPEALEDKNILLRPGHAQFVRNAQTPSHLILLDTPDFDTGLQGDYVNRKTARQALEVSDILIYIFTNANYNNRDNTDFISDILTGIGTRKCFLVYRVYAGYTDEEIMEHAGTVAKNLYGKDASEQVLGIYRADEDNRVAAGETFMTPRPVGEGTMALMAAMARLDRDLIRRSIMSSILRDVVKKAAEVSAQAEASLLSLHLYRDALQIWQSHCVRQALKRFPMDILLKRFMALWHTTDPRHVKWMRKAGHFIDWPIRTAVKTVKWFRGKDVRPPENEAQAHSRYAAESSGDLLTAANELWRKLMDPEISVTLAASDPASQQMLETFNKLEVALQRESMNNPHQMRDSGNGKRIFNIKAHPAVHNKDGTVDADDWRSAIQSILASKDMLFDTSGQIDRDLEKLVVQFRERMGWLEKIGQTFSAFLNVLPATVAVTYILSTGDPVGAAGIKVKLSGLFGVKDLYALVALPATSGLRKADRSQLEALMASIAKTWIDNKLETIKEIFEETISGEILAKADQCLKESALSVRKLNQAIRDCSTTEK